MHVYPSSLLCPSQIVYEIFCLICTWQVLKSKLVSFSIREHGFATGYFKIKPSVHFIFYFWVINTNSSHSFENTRACGFWTQHNDRFMVGRVVRVRRNRSYSSLVTPNLFLLSLCFDIYLSKLIWNFQLKEIEIVLPVAVFMHPQVKYYQSIIQFPERSPERLVDRPDGIVEYALQTSPPVGYILADASWRD